MKIKISKLIVFSLHDVEAVLEYNFKIMIFFLWRKKQLFLNVVNINDYFKMLIYIYLSTEVEENSLNTP